MSAQPESLSVADVKIRGPLNDAFEQILTPEAVEFLFELDRRFAERRRELLDARRTLQAELDLGKLPDFRTDTASIRKADWTVAPIPADLRDRRVEITGPVDRKMIINALNSGANVFMADLEDANSPTWENTVQGQINLRDAVRRNIAYEGPEGKQYRLNQKTAVLMVRPRGWHLAEKHMLVGRHPISASLFDFGLYLFHNAKELVDRGTGPYFYLPKLENHLEARLWNDVFVYAQKALGLPNGTIRATVLIETILATFEMDEILYELRDHSAGLNCGRWDYIFSFIKKFSKRADFLLPDRASVTMDRHFLKSYVELLIQTCHRREIHAMGGMAAQIPIKNDPEANERALEKVRQDKLREVKAGHDGTWVAHPALVPVAKAVFDEFMPQENQIANKRLDVKVTAEDLLRVPEGEITEAGVRLNVDVGMQYMAAWLNGSGAVPIYNLMEDAATAEISRSQLWQWVRHSGKLNDGRPVTIDMVDQIINEERNRMGDRPRINEAADVLRDMVHRSEFTEFLTLLAYDHLE
ncbi:MAG TPA: malate synthase A [Bryobacteraceae bacterium]|nr:malate synthase A [Bryobacteraceae bacterium]